MKKGGHYCLNVNDEIYKNACVPILGKATTKFKLKKETRIKSDKSTIKKSKYQEYVYIWIK